MLNLQLLNMATMSSVSILLLLQATNPLMDPAKWLENGAILCLAIFLLWQTSSREGIIRKETNARESRMADRIDRLEQAKTDLLKDVTQTVQELGAIRSEIRSAVSLIEDNTRQCNHRRDEMLHEIKLMKGDGHGV